MYQVTYGRYNLEELSAIPINPMLQDKILFLNTIFSENIPKL